MGWAMIYRIHDAYLIYGIGWSTLLWAIAAYLIRKRTRTRIPTGKDAQTQT